MLEWRSVKPRVAQEWNHKPLKTMLRAATKWAASAFWLYLEHSPQGR